MEHRHRFYLWFLVIVAFCSGWLFSPALNVYFSADDYYNMDLVSGYSAIDIVKSFLFKRYENYLFYRPLTTHLYFYLWQHFFDLQPIAYHLASYILFASILFLTFTFSRELFKSSKIALYSSIFYAFSASNFGRLAWISQMQEIGFTILALLCLRYWVKRNYALSMLFLILALTAKETAVILPLLLVLLTWYGQTWRNFFLKILYLIPSVIIIAIYLYFRLFLIGVSAGGHYFTDLRLQSIGNTLLWYLLWAIGIPELFVNFNFFEGPYILNIKLVNYLLNEMPEIFISFTILLLLILTFIILIIRKTFLVKGERENKTYLLKIMIFSILWFVVTLIPHLFSPFHKFPYELTLPLIGFSILLASFVLGASSFLPSKNSFWSDIIPKFFVVIYFIVQLYTVRVESWNSWVVQRGNIARNVIHFFKKNYLLFPAATKFIFFNDVAPPNSLMGVSKQISLALSESRALKLFYHNNTARLYFEDDGLTDLVCTEQTIFLRSTTFTSP